MQTVENVLWSLFFECALPTQTLPYMYSLLHWSVVLPIIIYLREEKSPGRKQIKTFLGSGTVTVSTIHLNKSIKNGADAVGQSW